MVWMPAHLQFENGGESVALMPTRYPGSGGAADGGVAAGAQDRMGEIGPEQYRGLGQRILTTSDAELGLLEVRESSCTQRQRPPDRSPWPSDVRKRLQPALLDRLTDDEPEQRTGDRGARVMSKTQLRQAVLRDLAWLFNAMQPLGDEAEPLSAARRARPELRLAGAVRAARLELDVGDLETRDPPGDPALRAAHPRRHAGGQARMEVGERPRHHNVIGFEIRGQLWAQPVPLEFLLRTELDLETGQVEMRDVAGVAPSKAR